MRIRFKEEKASPSVRLMILPFRKVQQITENHCGPAVLEMLLDAIGMVRSQPEIVAAAGITDEYLEEFGMRVDQIALACNKVAPQAQFWYKFEANLEDIRYVLDCGYGVAVEWQSLFYDSVEEEQEEEPEGGDFGHYSIISHYDDELQQLIIVDPYKDFARQDRIIPVSFFLQRWWDTNVVREPGYNYPRTVTDQQLMFFVTPKGEYFPKDMGFKPYFTVNQ